jgi:hypothetical protein
MAARLGIASTRATFETADSPVDVWAFYRDEMQKVHWELMNTTDHAGLDKAVHFRFSQIRRGLKSTSYTVDITAELTPEGHTRVTLVKDVLII